MKAELEKAIQQYQEGCKTLKAEIENDFAQKLRRGTINQIVRRRCQAHLDRNLKRPRRDFSRHYDSNQRLIPFTCRSGCYIRDRDALDQCIENDKCSHCLGIRHCGLDLMHRNKRPCRPQSLELLVLAKTGKVEEICRLWNENRLKYAGSYLHEAYGAWIQRELGTDYQEIYLGYNVEDDIFVVGAESERESILFEFRIRIKSDDCLPEGTTQFQRNPRGVICTWSWHGKFIHEDGFYCEDFKDDPGLIQIH